MQFCQPPFALRSFILIPDFFFMRASRLSDWLEILAASVLSEKQEYAEFIQTFLCSSGCQRVCGAIWRPWEVLLSSTEPAAIQTASYGGWHRPVRHFLTFCVSSIFVVKCLAGSLNSAFTDWQHNGNKSTCCWPTSQNANSHSDSFVISTYCNSS